MYLKHVAHLVMQVELEIRGCLRTAKAGRMLQSSLSGGRFRK